MVAPNYAETRRGLAKKVCNPKTNSFSMAIARRYEETADRLGQQVVVRDLYRLGFDPILKASEEPSDHFAPAADVLAELAAIDGANVLVLIYARARTSALEGAGLMPRSQPLNCSVQLL